MFIKGLLVGLFIGVVIGFFSAGMMAVSHTQEKEMDEQGAMMAGGKVERPYDWPAPPPVDMTYELIRYLEDDDTDDDFETWLRNRRVCAEVDV